jgi:DnaJ-class molecular chaperone
MWSGQDYYQVLSVTPDSSLQDVDKAYRKMAFRFHPDRNMMSDECNERMKQINIAYTAISEDIKIHGLDHRAMYRNSTPKFQIGDKVRVNAHSKTYRAHTGVVDKEPVKDMFRYWYMVKLEQKDFTTITRFAEEELDGVG